ncbi:alpha/beta hydrolase [Cyanobacteria bacterium FACHB-63]|nr:alpha/beta hydrolase [Cyanobacteria bacterium FACHB-63]
MVLERIARSLTHPAQKENILFIHGAYHAAWCWDVYFLDYFAQAGYCAHALSLRGHGKSECLGFPQIGFDDYLDDLDRTLQQLGQNTILVGHSMGGMLVQKYIETHAVPAAVILSSAAPQALRTTGKRLLQWSPFKTLRMLLTGNPDIVWHDSKVIQNAFFGDDMLPELQQYCIQQICSQSEPGKIMLKQLVNLKFHRPAHRQRVLVIKGKQDQLVSDQGCEMLANIHGSQPVVLDNLPHDLMLSQNWRQAADTILKWLQNPI